MTQQLQQSSYDASYMNSFTPSALHIRYDNTQILESFELFLCGKKMFIMTLENGDQAVNFEKIAEPKASEEGIQAIHSIISTLINNSTVQGNLSGHEFTDFCADFRIEVTQELIINRPAYGLDSRNIEPIIDRMVRLARLFISRTINNEERISLMTTMRNYETTTVKGGENENKPKI